MALEIDMKPVQNPVVEVEDGTLKRTLAGVELRSIGAVTMTTADRWFEMCLRERGHDPGEHEPDLSGRGLTKRPEYVATSQHGDQAAFEVKSFSQDSKLARRLRTGQPVSASPEEVFGPIRQQVSAAAAQLKGLATDMPAVVVLANPEGAPVDLSATHVLAALYGNPQYTAAIDTSTGAATGPLQFELGRDGKLTTDHPYLSAVVILHRRERRQDAMDELSAEARAQPGWEEMSNDERATVLLDVINANSADFPEGEYHWVEVLDTISASLPDGPANALPDWWFPHPRDTRWRFNSAGYYERVQGPDTAARP